MNVVNPVDQAINSANFVQAAKMIEYSNIQPALVENVVKHQLQRKRMTYAYPATIGNAHVHRDAYKFGYNPSRRGEAPRVCPCCLEKVQTEDIGLCYHTSKVEIQQEIGYSQYKLKPGLALFFSFIKMITTYFLLRFLISDGFNLLTNITSGQYCNDDSQTECYPILWNLLSLYNKKNNTKFVMIQDILSLVVVIISIVFFFVYRKSQYGMAKVLNNRNQVEQDYTLLIENIPLIDFPSKADAKKMRHNQSENIQLYHRQHLWKYFQSKIKTWLDKKNNWGNGNNQLDFKSLLDKNDGQLRSNQIVKSISLCYNLQRLETLEKQRNQLVYNRNKYQKLRKQLQDQADDSSLGIVQVQSDNRFSSVPKQVQFLNDCEVILNKQYASDNSVLFNITNFVGKALISFQYQHYRQYVLQEADRDLNFLVFNGSRLKVSRVSNPRDILWKNMRHSKEKQKKKLLATLYILTLISLACLLLLCGIQFGRIKADQAFSKDNSSLFGKFGTYGFVAASILVISLTNQFILVMARKRTKQQCLYSKTAQSHSIILKVVIFQFICTALFPYVVSRIFNSQIAGKTGLIFQMTALVIFYGLFMNILSLLFPKAIGRSLVLFFKYKNKKPQDQINVFQKQLNKQFQYVQFDIINQYANYILLAFVTCFYVYLIPILSLALTIIFFLQFWIDKINLFKRSSFPRSFSFYLTRIILKIFESCVWIFAIGTFVFGFYIHGNLINILNLITVGLASVYLWFLLGASIKLQRKLFGNYQSSQSALYDDCVSSGKFEETYWTQNPATYLVKESDITGRQSVSNPGLNKIFVNYESSS